MNPFSAMKTKEKATDLSLFVIFDSKSQSYDLPYYAVNADVMKRDLLNMMRDPRAADNKYKVNAEDYSVFKIGTFDKKTGLVSPQNLEHVANLHDLRALAGPVEPAPQQ